MHRDMNRCCKIRTFHCLDITMSLDICCCKRLLHFSAAIITDDLCGDKLCRLSDCSVSAMQNIPATFIWALCCFCCSSEYYCTMNFIQSEHCRNHCTFCTGILKKKKFLPYLMIILVASTFHKSALILIPFFFINLIPLNKWGACSLFGCDSVDLL